MTSYGSYLSASANIIYQGKIVALGQYISDTSSGTNDTEVNYKYADGETSGSSSTIRLQCIDDKGTLQTCYEYEKE